MKKIRVNLKLRNENNHVPIPDDNLIHNELIMCYNDSMQVRAVVVKRDGNCTARMDWKSVKFKRGFF